MKKNYNDKFGYCAAAFKAEHQLVSLQNQGVIDYVYTEDSDAVVCGMWKQSYYFQLQRGQMYTCKTR